LDYPETVFLEYDVGDRDQYGRLLAYVYVNDLMYNAKLAMEGYANQVTYQPNVRCEALLRAQVQDARQNDRGLWVYDDEQGSKITGTTGKLVIEKVDYRGEIVTIINKDSKTVNLSNWTSITKDSRYKGVLLFCHYFY